MTVREKQIAGLTTQKTTLQNLVAGVDANTLDMQILQPFGGMVAFNLQLGTSKTVDFAVKSALLEVKNKLASAPLKITELENVITDLQS